MDEPSERQVTPKEGRAGERLDSWKEIAAYLRRDVRTVQRWEHREGLPVHRHTHNERATVYAYKSEVDAWLENDRPGLEDDQPMGWVSFLGKNPKTTIGITIGVVLTLLAGLLVWMDVGSSSNPEDLNFQERDWVLIADFENRTGEAVFDGVLEYALEREISNSQFVNVIPRERIEDTLRLMRKPVDTPIDRNLGREICLRDGDIKALLTGKVEKLDSTYLLSVQVVDPSQGQAIATASEQAVGQKQVLFALGSLSNWARENLGEKLALIQERERKLERAATPSLRAIQLYTDARTVFDRGQIGQGPAEQLLRQALEIDPEFASASIWLAWTLLNQRESFDDYIQHAERAFQLAATTSDQERYFVHGSYYWMKGELDKAIHAFEALLGLYPDHYWATHKLGELYRQTGQQEQALTYWLRRADLRPNNLPANYIAANQLAISAGDWGRAQPYLQRALNLLTPEVIRNNTRLAAAVMLFPASEALVSGDPPTALTEANRVLQKLRSFGALPNPNVPLGTFYLALGKRELARELLKNAGDQRWSHWSLARAANAEGDHQAVEDHLRSFLGTVENIEDLHTSPPGVLRNTCTLLARAGFLSEAEKLLPTLTSGLLANPSEVEMVRGVFEVSRGNIAEGTMMLEKSLPLIRFPGLYVTGSEVLAESFHEQGDLLKAAQVLETASERQSVRIGVRWLKLQAQLAQLYREMGRDVDALKIEGELRKRLALADPDHPILRQLDRTEELALREPTNN